MKKVLILSIIFLSGCSNKLTCTYETVYEDIEIKNKIVFNFKEDKLEQVDKMIFEDSISASKYYDEIESYKEEYNLNLEDNIIVSHIVDDIKLDGDKEKIKDQYESYDYKCR